MDDLERRIRRARPGTVTRTAPLSARAEAELAALISDPAAPAARRWPRAVAPLLSGAAILTALLVIALSTLAPHAATATTPPPLTYGSYALKASEALQKMSDAALTRPENPSETQVIRMQSWALNITDDGADLTSFILPEVVTITREPDGTRDIVVLAGEPYDGDGQLATDPDAPAPGTELWADHNEPGEYEYLFPVTPPSSKTAMEAYLAECMGIDPGRRLTSTDVVGAATELMLEWSLTPAQESALMLTLAGTIDIEVAGTTVDRLGRAGVAFQTPVVDGYQRVLVVGESTGQILSIETVYVGGNRSDIPSPSVVAYFAWERNQ